MQPASIGTRVRVLHNETNHSYTVGGVYTVSHLDDDGTFRATDGNGRTGNWIRWCDCEAAGAATWHQIAADMPEPLVRFLSCFDGINAICLRESVIDAVLARLPDLHERILAFAATPSGDVATLANRPTAPQPPKN